jgi:peptidoglycan/LPS O-acetylase OafA/YrhL
VQHAYRPDIDGLRAVAVISVVVFHAFPGALPGGFVGVDIFFVISGYLISGIILSGIERGHFSFLDFYARRVRRILPALVLVLLTTAVLGFLLLLPDEYLRLKRHVIAATVFLSNFALWSEAGYFDVSSNLKPLLHLWSLGVEEQFYTVWPFVLVLMFKLRTRALPAIAVIGGASLACSIYLSFADQAAAFFFPLARFWELMLGSGLAAAGMRLAFRSERLAEIASAAGLALIGISLALAGNHHLITAVAALLPTLGAALLIGAGPRTWVNRTLLAHPAAVGIGLISYPLYLWHWPLLSFAKILSDSHHPHWGLMVLLVAVAFGLAYLTYKFIETPIRSAKSPRFAVPLLGTLATVCGLAVIAGIPMARKIANDPLVWDDALLRTNSCLARYHLDAGLQPFCLDLNKQVAPSILVLGDSHSNHWMPGLARTFPDAGIVNIAAGTCMMLEGLESYSEKNDRTHQGLCARTTKEAYDALRASGSITTVVLSSHVAAYTDPVLSAEGQYILKTATGSKNSPVALYAAALRRNLDLFASLGKKVVIVLDIPDLGFEPTDCLRQRVVELRTIREPCVVDRGWAEKQQASYRQTTKDAAAEFRNVLVLDPFDVLCKGSVCSASLEGQFLYRDRDHLSVAGSAQIIDRLLDENARRWFEPAKIVASGNLTH